MIKARRINSIEAGNNIWPKVLVELPINSDKTSLVESPIPLDLEGKVLFEPIKKGWGVIDDILEGTMPDGSSIIFVHSRIAAAPTTTVAAPTTTAPSEFYPFWIDNYSIVGDGTEANPLSFTGNTLHISYNNIFNSHVFTGQKAVSWGPGQKLWFDGATIIEDPDDPGYITLVADGFPPTEPFYLEYPYTSYSPPGVGPDETYWSLWYGAYNISLQEINGGYETRPYGFYTPA